MSVTLPPGWIGHVLPGELDAIAPHGAFVQFSEATVSGQRYLPLPRRLRGGTTRRFVRVGGRAFFLFVHATAGRLAAAERVLASIRVRAWTAPLAAPRFAASAGWYTGSSGPQPRSSDSYLSAWASTARYVDGPIDLPPAATLARMGRRGVVVWVGLSSSRYRQPVRRDPLDLGRARCTWAWEGGIPGVMQCVLWSRVPGRYDISVYVYVKRRSRLATAQGELRRLALPSWSR